MNDLETLVERGVTQIKNAATEPPRVAIVLGSGLGGVAGAVEGSAKVPLHSLPGHPAPTVEGHRGVLLLGRLAGVPVAILEGRLHGYEGHSLGVVTLALRMVLRLGVRTLVLTNAAGGINRDFRPGDLMLITDHLNLLGRSPLEGANVPGWGPRFPDMTATYPIPLRAIVRQHAEAAGIDLRQGVYACLAGPQYETPAEVRMLRILGADAVGMSTVPEAIVASHMGIPVLGISMIAMA